MTQTSNADIVGLFVFIAALVFSADVAAVVGPYIVIGIAAVIGASFSLSRRAKSTRVGALWFFVRIALLAMLITGIISAIAVSYQPDLPERLLLAPIALLIGWIGDDWPAVFAKLMRMVWGAVDLVRGGKGGAS